MESNNNFQKMFHSIMEKRSRIRGNLRLKVLLKSQYEVLHRRYLAEVSEGNCLYYTGAIMLNGIPDSHSVISVSNCDESSKKNVISKKRVNHLNVVRRLQNKRFKTLSSDSASQSSKAECLINNQNSSVQSQKKLSFASQIWNECGKENEVVRKKSGARGSSILQTMWEKNMFQCLGDWLKKCGINVHDKECYFSPYLNHPINASHYQGIRDLLLMWDIYLTSRSTDMTQFQHRKNTKIAMILKILVQQYRAYQETNGDNEILNLQLRKNRCKLKKLARKLFNFHS